MIRILHLTDFHLNNKTLKDWNDFMRVPFLNKIDELNKDQNIDLVLFTGDLIDQAGKDFGSVTNGLNTFNEEVIKPILEKLNLDISKFIICPGNHDINRNADKAFAHSGLTNELKSIEAVNAFTNTLEDDYDGIQRIKEYKLFEFELYKDVNEKVHSKFKFSIKLNINDKSVGITSLNTSWRCYGNDDCKNLLVGENQLNDNFKFIEDCELKIALMHHQLDWLSGFESKIIKSHISSNYDIVLSGHVHETDVEFVQNLTGTCLKIVSPSGLNQIRSDGFYANGFSVIDYGSDNKCYFYKYNHSQRLFVQNTDVCDNGVLEIDINRNTSTLKNIETLILDEEFKEFLKDSGANFTHRSKALTLDDIYVFPYMEQFSLNDEEEKGGAIKSEDILKKIIQKEIRHIVILGEENSGKTSFCKQIIKTLLLENNNIPVFIKGRDIKKVTREEIDKLVQKEIRKQYKEAVNLEEKDIFIVIDDLNNCKLPQKSKKTFILNLQSFNYYTIITWDEYFTLSDLLESQITTLEVFEILKFGGKKRFELIRKWINLIDDVFDDDQTKEFQIKELVKTVNAVIGKNLIPSLPIYILTILQANELASTTNFEQSTFGHYYDVLIRSALGKKIKANSEIEKYYSYLTEFSFWLNKKGTIEVTESEFIEFHKFFTEKYQVQLSFRDALFILEECNLIQNQTNLYKFKYKYIYFYFFGKYLSDNIENKDIQSKVCEISNNLYQTESANIYIFLSHHSKSKFVIDQIINRAKELFKDEVTIGFNSDINSINNLIKDTTDKIHLEKIHSSSESEVYAEVEIADEKFDNEIPPKEGDTDENIDSISKINKAFKTIEILGYIIKNRYASLVGSDKLELVEELYKLGLRSLTFLFRTLLEGEEYIKNEIIDIIKKDPNSALTMREREDLAKQFMFNLLYMVSYSIFKRISSSISSKDLEITFNDVLTKNSIANNGEKNNAVSLIDMSVKFEYSKSFPVKDVKDLSDQFKNNRLANNILRRLGVNFMRMIPLKESDQQKASEILDISIDRQRIISATSSIKK
ncbi:metallophosphoesterase [Sphingobacterium litopenaei]|uniref:Metallophosphoesterase n=1 Tax=Sphingobacterium litopenaei TaxID=2763500 RepID=A0ABR7YB36_9SPHI|nr:metallophosphoesterase [Sphingobacterium litopenaei]MBD1428506.1 metallophosphoesterase [Sphingobacterium litopenaei]